jgi:dTMP kinase
LAQSKKFRSERSLNTGKFVTFEGIDGCGKTTQVKSLEQFLISKGFHVLVTREPGGTKVAEKIRDILLDRDNIELHPRAELLLYLASRAQHTAETIVPALTSGVWVISDRFYDSSIAYQGAGRNLGMDVVEKLSLFATDNLSPDITFFLDISPETAERRMVAQSKIKDRLEAENEQFIALVRKGYLQLAQCEPNRIKIIDAERPAEPIGNEIIDYIKPFLV